MDLLNITHIAIKIFILNAIMTYLKIIIIKIELHIQKRATS